MRYPEQKQEYENAREELLEATPFNDGQPRSNFPANRLEAAVIKLNSPRMLRMEREIRAVEHAYNGLTEDQKKVIRIRFWSCRWKKVPYADMDAGYGDRQMKRIVHRVMYQIGSELGEIK